MEVFDKTVSLSLSNERIYGIRKKSPRFRLIVVGIHEKVDDMSAFKDI